MGFFDPGIRVFDAVIYLGVGFLTDSIMGILVIFGEGISTPYFEI